MSSDDYSVSNSNFIDTSSLTDDVSVSLHLSDLFEELDDFIENSFPLFVTLNEIEVLKLKFLNQKRIIRKHTIFNFRHIINAILKLQTINHCEIQYVCEVMDSMQEADFTNIILGRNLSISYPQFSSTRWPFVMWILRCQLTFRAQHDTFQQAVVIFDQYMLRNDLLDGDSYLKLALVSFFVSSKMEEIEMPDIDRLLLLADNKFTAESVYELEIEVLKSIDYGVMIHAPVKYLQMIVLLYNNARMFPFIYEFSKVLIDLCVLHSDLACYPSCFIAAASFCVSQYMTSRCNLDGKLWNENQMYLTGIRWRDIEWMCGRLKNLIHKEFNDIWEFLNEKVSLDTLRAFSWSYLREMCNPSRFLN